MGREKYETCGMVGERADTVERLLQEPRWGVLAAWMGRHGGDGDSERSVSPPWESPRSLEVRPEGALLPK